MLKSLLTSQIWLKKAITSNIKSKAKVLLLDEAQDFTPLHWKAIYTAFKDVEEMYVAGRPDAVHI